MLVDHLELTIEHLRVVDLRKLSIQHATDRCSHPGPARLLLLPVKYELVLYLVEKSLGRIAHGTQLAVRQLRCWFCQQVKDSEFCLRHVFLDNSTLLCVESTVQLGESA